MQANAQKYDFIKQRSAKPEQKLNYSTKGERKKKTNVQSKTEEVFTFKTLPLTT